MLAPSLDAGDTTARVAASAAAPEDGSNGSGRCQPRSCVSAPAVCDTGGDSGGVVGSGGLGSLQAPEAKRVSQRLLKTLWHALQKRT
jgi:hypothetical protein